MERDSPLICTRQGILQYAVQQTENPSGSMVAGRRSGFLEWKLGYGSVQKRSVAVGSTRTPSLSVEHKDIEFVEHFQYLGSNISREDDADDAIYTRLGTGVSVQYGRHKNQ